MYQSFLVVAALVTAAPGDMPGCAECSATAPAQQQAVGPPQAALRVGLLDRLFHRRPAPASCKPCAAARKTNSAEPPAAAIRTVSGTESPGGVVPALAEATPAVS